jgi:hypothetical protein
VSSDKSLFYSFRVPSRIVDHKKEVFDEREMPLFLRSLKVYQVPCTSYTTEGLKPAKKLELRVV